MIARRHEKDDDVFAALVCICFHAHTKSRWNMREFNRRDSGVSDQGRGFGKGKWDSESVEPSFAVLKLRRVCTQSGENLMYGGAFMKLSTWHNRIDRA